MYQQYNIVDVKNPFEEEDTTAVIVCSLHVHTAPIRGLPPRILTTVSG